MQVYVFATGTVEEYSLTYALRLIEQGLARVADGTEPQPETPAVKPEVRLAALENAVFGVEVRGDDLTYTTTSGKYVDADDGTLKDATGFNATSLINVSGKAKLMFPFPYYSASTQRLLKIGYAFYDNDEEYLCGYVYIADITVHTEDVKITVPANAKYARFTVDTAIHSTNFYVADVDVLTLKQYVDAAIDAATQPS